MRAKKSAKKTPPARQMLALVRGMEKNVAVLAKLLTRSNTIDVPDPNTTKPPQQLTPVQQARKQLATIQEALTPLDAAVKEIAAAAKPAVKGKTATAGR